MLSRETLLFNAASDGLQRSLHMQANQLAEQSGRDPVTLRMMLVEHLIVSMALTAETTRVMCAHHALNQIYSSAYRLLMEAKSPDSSVSVYAPTDEMPNA